MACLKVEKTQVTHTLNEHEGHTGFDFLGFTIQQYRVGKYHAHKRHAGYKTLIMPSRKAVQRHLRELKAILRQYRGAPQAALIADLNPKIRGWALTANRCGGATIQQTDSLHHKLMRGRVFAIRKTMAGAIAGTAASAVRGLLTTARSSTWRDAHHAACQSAGRGQPLRRRLGVLGRTVGA
jgi:hypothetical protein